MLVSFLLPTRGRKDMFIKSIDSLISNATNPDCFEVLAGVDFDDFETIKFIQEFSNENTNISFIINSRQKQQSNDIYKTFFIKPDLQNDIYYLYLLNTTNFEGISKEIAHIPDYKTSIFMNKLFRNIKENNNLDSLEESDDE